MATFIERLMQSRQIWTMFKMCVFSLWIFSQIPPSSEVPQLQRLQLQIVMTEFHSTHRSTQNKVKEAMLHKLRAIATDRQYSQLKRKYRLNAELSFLKAQPTPREVLNLFCDEIANHHVNALVYFYRPMSSVESEDYIRTLADVIGLPIISWNPEGKGAMDNSTHSLVLQLAPTIFHQAQALISLALRYNWTDITIVTTTTIHNYIDFTTSVKQLVKENNKPRAHVVQPKLTIMETIICDEGRYEACLQEKIHADTMRIYLLHTGYTEAKDLLDAAKILNLTGRKYMWLMTTSCIFTGGTVSPSYPLGAFGLKYQKVDAAQNPLVEAEKSAMEIWALALKNMVQSSRTTNYSTMVPEIGCNSSEPVNRWAGGKTLYRYMKNIRLTKEEPFVEFSTSGVNKLVKLEIMNVKIGETRRGKYVRTGKVYSRVGSWEPKKRAGRHERVEMELNMDDITWPDNAPFPPKGKPEKIMLRIAMFKEKPYVIYGEVEETGTCSPNEVKCRLVSNSSHSKTYNVNGTLYRDACCVGLCMDLLKILSERMMFDFDLFEVPDQTWGILLNNKTGEWNGLIKTLLDGNADLVMTSLKITPERNSYIDFSAPFLETGITIIVAIRKGAISPTAFLEPYDYPSWCLILVFSVHATGASIFIFEWLSPSGLNQGSTPMREHKFSLFRSFWLIWAMLFGASVSTDNPRGMSSRFLANIWALFGLVFLASYTANLAAFMITKEEFYKLTGIQDPLLRNPGSTKPPFRFATVPNGSTEENLKRNHYEMYSYMRKYNQNTVDEGLAALKNQNIQAFIYDATVLEYEAGQDDLCSLTTVGKWYAMTGYGVGFPRKSPYLERFDQIILELQELGDMERLQKYWRAGACHRKQKTGHTSDKIGILNFTSAFILLACGMLLGGVLLALEHLYFKFGRKCLKKYDKCGCCALVSLSMGKSLTFEQSVMEAIDLHKRHRCKDPLCETQLWKVKHELDLALLKIDKMQNERIIGD